MNIKYKLSTKRTGNYAEVLVRFYDRSINQQTHTGVMVPIALWIEEDGRCSISKRYETPDNTLARNAQKKLDELTLFIHARYIEERNTIRAGWLQGVVADYLHPEAMKEPPLYDSIDGYCAARNVALETRKKMHSLRELMKQFTKETKVVLTKNLSKKDLEQFSMWLMADGTRSENSMHNRLRQLRTLLYWVGKPHPNPFDDYTIPADAYGTPIYLTQDERDFVYAYQDLTPSQKVQRDIFIFQCHTGCRIGDLYDLTPANVRDGWLVYVPHKTSRAKPATVEVPLSDVAVEIIDRYKGRDLKGRLLPFISKPGYNEMIHSVMRECALDRVVMVYDPLSQRTSPHPLWEVVTSHTARKTFTQMLYSATTDKRLVATMTGHSENSQAFNRYSEISREMKKAALDAANNLCAKIVRKTAP